MKEKFLKETMEEFKKECDKAKAKEVKINGLEMYQVLFTAN